MGSERALEPEAILATLERHGVRFVLVGGLASEIRRVPLPRTEDLDITPAREPDNLERLAVILAFIAVRLLQLREALLDDARSANAQRPCTDVLSKDEWHALWLSRERKKPPRKVPSLRWAYESIAKLGGWTDTKRTGRAGWDTMWYGWFRYQERLDIYLATRDLLK